MCNQKDEYGENVIFWSELLASFNHRTITLYYPQANGVAERHVGVIKLLLKKLLEGENTDWPFALPAIEYCINIRVHALSGLTPFEVMFPKKPIDLNSYAEKQIWNEEQIDVIELTIMIKKQCF